MISIADVPVPHIVRRLADYAAARGEAAASRALAVDLEPWLWGGSLEDSLLGEPGAPLELLPLARRSEVYVGLVLYAEGPEPVAATWAGSDGEACWLADDAQGALETLLAVAVRDASLHLATGEPRDVVVGRAREDAGDLATALGLSLARDVSRIDDGLRSDVSLQPEPPPGWRFEPCNDGIGVLAPLSAFDDDLAPESLMFDLGAELDRASGLLSRGFAASSLAVCRNAAHATVHTPDHLTAIRHMRAAYAALGRDWLARRADRYLARHGG